MLARSVRVCCTIALLAVVSTAPSRAGVLTKIASTNSPAPGGGTFGVHFGVPVIDADGRVAFSVQSTGQPTDTDDGVYAGTSPADLIAIARPGDALSSVGRLVAQSKGGYVTFAANGGTAIFGSGAVTTVLAQAGDMLQLGQTKATLSSVGDPMVADNGLVLFATSPGGIMTPGNLIVYAQAGQLPFSFLSFGASSVDAGGTVAYFANVEPSGSPDQHGAIGIASATTPAPTFLVLDNGDTLAGGAVINVNGSSASSPKITPQGIVFASTTSDGMTATPGIFRVTASIASTVTTIVKGGDPAPGGGTFATFDWPQVNSKGSIVFAAYTDGGPGAGVYRWTADHGVEAMALQGQGDIAGAAGFRNAVINDNDVVAFQAYRATGITRRSVYITDGVDTVRADPTGGVSFFGQEGSYTGAYQQAPYGSAVEGRSPLNDLAEVTFVAELGVQNFAVVRFDPDVRWRAAGSGTWDDPANWSLSIVPLAGTYPTIANPNAGTTMIVTGPSVPVTLAGAGIGDSDSSSGIAELDLQSGGPITATGAGVEVQDNGVLGGTGTIAGPLSNGGTVKGTITVDGDVDNYGLIDAKFTANGDVLNEDAGIIVGNPVFNGNVTNYGTIAPGHSPGIVTIGGDLSLQVDSTAPLVGSTLEMEVGGPDPGDYDVIDVGGQLTLAGTLHVKLLNGFTPTPGQKFHILNAAGVSGSFDAIIGADVTITADGIDVEPNGQDATTTTLAATTTTSSSTTSIASSSTTSTTLAPAGCTARTGFDGVQCVCAGGLGGAACAADHVPAAIGKLFGHGCALVQQAEGLSTPKKQKKIVRSAGAAFKKDLARVAKASKGKHALSAGCGAALTGTLADVKQRTDQSAGEL